MALVSAIFVALIWMFKDVVSLEKLGAIGSTHACSVGDTMQNIHVDCICTQKNVYQCVMIGNSSANTMVESTNENYSCHSNKVYVYESLLCICNKNGTWPHKKCSKTFKSLPEHNVVRNKCEPNSYVRIDCNVCRCGSNGIIDTDHCTKNDCDNNVEISKHRRSTEGTKLYGDCESRNWYSLAPCQFCYCVNTNKLVCNTGTSLMTNQMYLQLGSYNLHICGKQLIKELKDLVYNNEGLLRQGNGMPIHSQEYDVTSTTPNTVQKPTESIITVTKNIFKGVNHIKSEFIASKKEDGAFNTENDSSSKSDENSSEEEIAIHHKREKGSYNPTITQIPYQEDSRQNQDTNNVAAERQGDDIQYGSSDNEMLQESPLINVNIATTPKSATSSKSIVNEKPKVINDYGKNMKFDLPIVLDKVFKMALRRSMVTVNTDKTCVPGAVEVVKCNTCFCMKSAKMVCTKNKCNS